MDAAVILRRCGIVLAVAAAAMPVHSAGTLWNFDNPSNRLAATSGPGALGYFDPDATGWGPALSAFGKAGIFGLPAMPGGDADVMRFPACSPRQGYILTHHGTANGPYGETDGRVSNYTLILDVLYPAASDGDWRALYQANVANTDDAELFVQNVVGGGVGIDVYHGHILPNTWHRIAIVMQAAPREGKSQVFIDGQFVGGIFLSGSGLDLAWALSSTFLLFTDDDFKTRGGYVSSVFFTDRPMTMEEIRALGGPHAGGALTPGNAPPALAPLMPRHVGIIGHRGGDFCCAPDNTLAAVRRAIAIGVDGIEIDTRLSADGVCILMHDEVVDRTTDGTGEVAAMTVPQLKTLDAGSWFSPEFVGERVPTLAEVMTEARGRVILYLDLKVTDQIDAIMAAIDQTGFNPDDLWFWTSNDLAETAAIRARLPRAKIVFEPSPDWAGEPNYFANVRSLGVVGFDAVVEYGTVDSEFVCAAQEEGFFVSVFTIRDPDTMVRNAAAGAAYMETDFPGIMRDLQPTPVSEQPCCLPGRSCAYLTASTCVQQGGTPLGVQRSCACPTCSAPPVPPAVPDGDGATSPLIASRLTAAGDSIQVSWDALSCPAKGYNLMYGGLQSVGTYTLGGAVCSLGTTGSYAWTAVPAGDLYFLIVGTDGVATESSWGRDAADQERNGAASSGACGIAAKNVSMTCP